MKNTALLVMDYQNDILKLVEAKSATLLKNASALIQAARQSKVPVIYVQVAFRPGYPEVSSKNKSFGALKSSGRMMLGNPGTEIHAAVAPLAGESVVIKHRVGAYHETDLATILRGQEIEHLMMCGISTSGVILSTLRVAADADYKITVVEDACADGDEEVHGVLMKKVFPRQAEVISTQAALELLKA
jgi:nicotinamidase-related amidase